MKESWDTLWELESGEETTGRIRISLVRRRVHRFSKRLVARTETVERVVMFSRAFRPLLETVALEHYRAQLGVVARSAETGKFGCFVEVQPKGGNVEVTLYDRWFDGWNIRTEEVTRQAFASTDERSLVASTEFLAELQIWAERQNAEREAVLAGQQDADDARARLAAQRSAASRELSEILAAHTGAQW